MREPDTRVRKQSVDDGSACGRPFQDAAALLVDLEDEPDAVEGDDPDEPDDDPESDEEDDDAEDDSDFLPDPLSLLFDDPFEERSAARLSVR
jgi:hypothetical protein